MQDDNKPATANQEALGTGMAALVGVLMAGPPGAVIGAAAAPHLTELVRRAWGEVVAFREAQLESVVDESADLAGVVPDELVGTMQNDPEQRRLLHDTLIAAADARYVDKIHGLARCLANGFEDAARVDEEALIVRALVDLDPVHLRVLKELEHRPMAPRSIQILLTERLSSRDFLSSADIAAPILVVLERNGLVESESSQLPAGQPSASYQLFNETRYRCTPFGRECLSRLGNRNRRQTNREVFAD